MDVQLCEKCGKLFKAVIGEKCCAVCDAELREKQRAVQIYFETHENTTLEEAAVEAGVEEKFVRRWLKEGAVHSLRPLIPCDGCRKLIYTGKLCDDCKMRCYEMISRK